MSDIQIALIGYGEVGQTIASDLRVRGINAIRAFDVLFSDSLSSPSLIANERNDVLVCHNLKTALSAADVIISAVTAAECSAAAHAAAALLQPSAFWLDLNSVAPATKIETAAAIEQAGARYVEAAIM